MIETGKEVALFGIPVKITDVEDKGFQKFFFFTNPYGVAYVLEVDYTDESYSVNPKNGDEAPSDPEKDPFDMRNATDVHIMTYHTYLHTR